MEMDAGSMVFLAMIVQIVSRYARTANETMLACLSQMVSSRA